MFLKFWKNKWDNALRILEASNGGPLPNTYLLELMATILDEYSQKEIALPLRTNNLQSNQEYFAQLENNLTLQGSVLNQNQCRKVILPKTYEILTLARWRKFLLQEAISECENPSVPDWREHIIAQLPAKIQTQILKQEMNFKSVNSG